MRAAGRSLEEAEDLIQDAYAETMERLHLVAGILNLPAWINSLVTRRMIDSWRHERVRDAAARAALANIGDPAAGPTLAKVRVAASHDERAQAPALYLRYARRLKEEGRAPEALEAARSLLAAYGRPGEDQVAAEALSLLVSVLGEKALPDLISAVDSPAAAVRGAALEMAVKIGGKEATAGWTEKAAASGPEVRAAIVDMLGRRGDADALPFIRKGLGDSDASVRLAAIPAAVRLGVTALLVGFLVNGLFEWNFGDEELLYPLFVLCGMAWAARGWDAGPAGRPEVPR